MNKDKLWFALICALIGAMVMTAILIVIELHQPTQTVKTCNDGWSTQIEDGQVYKTYLPAEDTCRR